MKKNLFVIILLSFQIEATAQRVSLDQLIRAEFDTIKTRAHEAHATLEIEDNNTSSSRSYPDGKVIINKRQVMRLYEAIKGQHLDYIVRTIIAHEIAHQKQYSIYGNDFSESQVVKECQADIIAGVFLADYIGLETMANRNEVKNGGTSFIFGKIKEVLNLMIEVGDLSKKDHHHPLKAHRKRAIRDGMFFGMVMRISQFVMNPDVPEQDKTNAREILDRNGKMLDLTQGEVFIDWTLHDARKIVNAGNCSDFVVSDTVIWNRANGFTDYKQVFTNTGDANTEIVYNNMLYTIGNDTEDEMYWNVVLNHSHKIRLLPGEKKEITGRMDWKTIPGFNMQLIIPGMPGSYYSCHTFDSAAAVKKPTYEDALSSKHSKLSRQTALGILLSDRNQIASYRAGIGFFDNNITYMSKLEVPGATTFITYDEEYSFLIVFRGYSSNKMAIRDAKKIVDEMRDEDPRLDFILDLNTEAARKYHILSNRLLMGTVGVRKERSDSETYTVAVEIFGDEKKE